MGGGCSAWGQAWGFGAMMRRRWCKLRSGQIGAVKIMSRLNVKKKDEVQRIYEKFGLEDLNRDGLNLRKRSR